ncbi:MAG TPA: Ni/Fe hydrogenase subunit alpha [Capsulimonadaceae bacterium]|jgi:NAD-reducing hydrogenase large subunit
MGQEIIIDPVTRIEGHAKITVHLDDDGLVRDAEFHVTEFRGFEKFCEGRSFAEMPALTARICGICPVSHLLASAKTGDAILATRIPPTAEKLRRIMNLGQIVQSHALSFFYLSAPDMLLGWDSDPAMRNVVGIIKADENLARRGIRLRQFGQEVIEILGARRIHPAWAVPGGVRTPLSVEDRDAILRRIPEQLDTVKVALDTFKAYLDTHEDEIHNFGEFPSLYFGLVGPGGKWEHHDGMIRVVDSEAKIVGDNLDPAKYRDYIGEAVEPNSYLKFPYFREYGYPQGIYRVGPLARINICSYIGTPKADAQLAEFRKRFGRIANSSFLYHYARIIEMTAALEAMEQHLNDPEINSNHIRANAGVNQLEGVGVSEAPRGTLIHNYVVDENGAIKKVNLIIATGQNNLAMNRTVGQIAKAYIKGGVVTEGILNRIEAGIRAFDPCLSCSTHAVGSMPMSVRILASDGSLVKELKRLG